MAKELSEPLNPDSARQTRTARELSEWMVSTNCYPAETTSTDQAAIDHAAEQPAQAFKQLHEDFKGEAGLLRILDTDKDRGISESSVVARRERYGNNYPRIKDTKTICDMIMENLSDHFMILLMVAASVELALGIWQEGLASGWVDGFSIFMAVFIITAVNVCNSYKTEQTFLKLQNTEDDYEVRVMRDGKSSNINVKDVVVGDRLFCENGKKLNADGILVDGEKVKVNESEMTGELELMIKSSYSCENGQAKGKPFLFKSCNVEEGSGWMIVTSVGSNTNEGQMAKQMDFDKDLTPLQCKLNTIVEWIGIIGIVSAALVFLALVLRLVFDIWAFGTRSLTDESNINEIVQAFIVAVTVVVMAVPEGLPLAVTISLQFSISDLEKQYNTLIRRPDATETMGGCTEICSDKTGTLTANKMTAVAFWVEGKNHDNSEIRNSTGDDNATIHKDIAQLKTIKEIADAVLINSSAYESVDAKTGELELKGNPTEKALFQFFTKAGCRMDNDQAEDMKKKLIFSTPFDSKKKFSLAAYYLEDKSVRIAFKGAPDIMVTLANRIAKADGEVVPFTDDDRKEFNEVIDANCLECYRTIMVAYKDMKKIEWDLFLEKNDVNSKDDAEQLLAREALEEHLIISGIFGIEDPLRDGIETTIKKLETAGVRTRMCTGDNVKTARSICQKSGIIRDIKDEPEHIQEQMKNKLFLENRQKYTAMTGEEFRKEFGRQDEEGIWSCAPNKHAWRSKIIPHLKCLARSSPTDKQILVQGIQKYSENRAIVAVTGDGTNDCPALTMADVGFAMNDGSDAAKGVAKVILIDNNFSSTLVCVKFGRNIYDAVQKFLQFQLTVNVVAIAIVLLGAVVLNEKVMTSVQILWVNLIMDTFAALALATEPATEALLNRKPTDRDESIVSSIMARNVLGWSVYQIATLCVVLFCGKDMFGLTFRNEDPFYWILKDGVQDDGTCTIDTVTEQCAIVGGETDKLVLYTMVFNLFVWLQIFNQFNARKIQGEMNVWTGLCDNKWFIGISLITVIVQIVIIFIGGRPLRCTPLDMNQNLFTIGLAVGIIPWNLLVANIPERWFTWASACVPNKEQDEEEAANSSVMGMSGRASARMSTKMVKLKMQEGMKDRFNLMSEAHKKDSFKANINN